MDEVQRDLYAIRIVHPTRPKRYTNPAHYAESGDRILTDITTTTPDEQTTSATIPATTEPQHEDHETALESLASICTVLAVGLFVMAFVFQNYEIPSASMEKTLLIGDHVLVDHISLAPPSHWVPLVHYREVQRGDVIVFLKPHQQHYGQFKNGHRQGEY